MRIKPTHLIPTILLGLCASSLALAQDSGPVHQSQRDASQASGQASEAAARLASTGVVVALAVTAVPSVVKGMVRDSARQVITQSARDSGIPTQSARTKQSTSSISQSTSDQSSAPLEISPETVIAQPAPKVPYDAAQKPQ